MNGKKFHAVVSLFVLSLVATAQDTLQRHEFSLDLGVSHHSRFKDYYHEWEFPATFNNNAYAGYTQKYFYRLYIGGSYRYSFRLNKKNIAANVFLQGSLLYVSRKTQLNCDSANVYFKRAVYYPSMQYFDIIEYNTISRAIDIPLFLGYSSNSFEIMIGPKYISAFWARDRFTHLDQSTTQSKRLSFQLRYSTVAFRMGYVVHYKKHAPRIQFEYAHKAKMNGEFFLGVQYPFKSKKT